MRLSVWSVVLAAVIAVLGYAQAGGTSTDDGLLHAFVLFVIMIPVVEWLRRRAFRR